MWRVEAVSTLVAIAKRSGRGCSSARNVFRLPSWRTSLLSGLCLPHIPGGTVALSRSQPTFVALSSERRLLSEVGLPQRLSLTMPLSSCGGRRRAEREPMGRHGTGVQTLETAALSAAALPAGWYRDPFLRWKARYWDGRSWTERVALPGHDPTRPVYGQDPVLPPARADLFLVDPALVRLVEAACAEELAHLRTEVETWREVADERARALGRALNALELLAAGRTQLEARPKDRGARPEDASAAQPTLAAVPDAVRAAALSELICITSKQRRWWRRS